MRFSSNIDNGIGRNFMAFGNKSLPWFSAYSAIIANTYIQFVFFVLGSYTQVEAMAIDIRYFIACNHSPPRVALERVFHLGIGEGVGEL